MDLFLIIVLPAPRFKLSTNKTPVNEAYTGVLFVSEEIKNVESVRFTDYFFMILNLCLFNINIKVPEI